MSAPQQERLEPEQFAIIIAACYSGDTAQLAKAIEGVNPDLLELTTGLGTAIKQQNFDMMRCLLDLGVEVTPAIVQFAGLKPRSIRVLELLREYGWEDVNMRLDSCVTALNVSTHDPNLVRYLLERGADPNLGPGTCGDIGMLLSFTMIPDSGYSLRSALIHGSVESFDLLLEHGGRVANQKLLHAAVEGGHISAIARALEVGADINEIDDPFKNGIYTFRTPLIRAIATQRPEVVRFLLENGASVTELGDGGQTPLQIVRRECCSSSTPCRVHEREMPPEIKEMIETAVESEAGLHVTYSETAGCH